MDVDNQAEAGGDVVAPDTGAQEAEAKAKRLGWVEADKFKGDPAKHISAEEFLKRGETLVPFLQRDNDKLHQGMSKLERQLKEQGDTLQKFVEFSSKAEERAYKRAKAELEAKLDSAIETADVAGAKQVRKEIEALDEDAKAAVKPASDKAAVQIDPEIQSWINDPANEWFRKDAALNAAAVKIYGKLERDKPGVAKSELLAETKRQVMDKFPEDFGINPTRESAAAVASPSGGGARKKGGKTFDDLPAEAKAACNKFVKTIPGYTKEQYVKDYDWD